MEYIQKDTTREKNTRVPGTMTKQNKWTYKEKNNYRKIYIIYIYM